MLKHVATGTPRNINRWLLRKMGINIMATNVCNLKCNGCSQLIPCFRERWFIPLSQLEDNIRYFREFVPHKLLGLFGGEPLLHPQWKQIEEMMWSYPNTHFIVFSNGIKGVPQGYVYKKAAFNHDFSNKNVTIAINEKSPGRKFVNTLNALQDNMECNKRECAIFALKNCQAWGSSRCWLMVYDNKAYLCEQAAAWERLRYGPDNWQENSHGWDLTPNSYVFHKTKEDIIQQATNVCFQCGFALRRRVRATAKRNPYEMASKTNKEFLDSINMTCCN